ncbi:MAG: hypothetical protein Fur007_24280 [Rhodoferax sp.]
MNTEPLRIEGELTIFRAMELKPVLLANPAPEAIDLSEVTDFDTAGLQLLMMAKRAAQAQGNDLRLLNHSPVVLDVFERLNVAGFFGFFVIPCGTCKVRGVGVGAGFGVTGPCQGWTQSTRRAWP